MASLLVLVAHSGRTLQLDVQPSTRVDAVQHALVSFTGIPVTDQIAMYQGARLDPNKLLGAYRLPVDPSTAHPEDHPVFLYYRSYLKPGAALPPPEALPPLQVQVPPLAEVNLAHPLHSAPSPLVRALPDYERHFQHHLATTRAYWDVAQARLQRCRQLLSEQEVQARAADAARANVEAHYTYILDSYQTFLDKYNAQHAAHALLLSNFPSDLAALEAIELHPALQQQQQPQARPQQQPQAPTQPGIQAGSSAGQQQHQLTGPEQQLTGAATAAAGPAAAGPAPPRQRLSDLYPVQRLRDWAETCGRSHASFGAKVAELEALFQLLRKDVEGLFMQAPSVDLDALGRQMAEHEALLDEHSSMVQVLSKDLRTVRALVEDVVRQLGSAGAGGGAGGGGGGGAGGGGAGGIRQGALHDAAAAMEAIHETHRTRVLPRLAQLDARLATFAAAVETSKVAMSRDVLGQLQRISGQQSRIRDMKNKLAAFHEVLGRQDAAFAELKVVHRLPSAYRALLAEVVRRHAWHQLYCGQAGRLAEHMARFRDKEAGRRAAFSTQVARYIPGDLLVRAGLAAEPPHCGVTVPPPDVPLIAVAMADLQRLSYLDERLLAATLRASSAFMAGHAAVGGRGPQHGPASSHDHPHHHQHGHQQHPHGALGRGFSAGGAAVAGGGGGTASASSSTMAFPGTVAVLDADPPPPTDTVSALEMENARLRAELANHIAAACIRELAPAAGTSGEAAGGQQQQQQQPAQGADAASSASPPAQPATGSASAVASAAGSPAAAGTGNTAPAGTASSRRDPAELVAAMHRALGMKDDLIRQQQREVATLAARASTYEQRIGALEALLDKRAIEAGVAAAAVAATAAAAVTLPSGGGVREGGVVEGTAPEAADDVDAGSSAGPAAQKAGLDAVRDSADGLDGGNAAEGAAREEVVQHPEGGASDVTGVEKVDDEGSGGDGDGREVVEQDPGGSHSAGEAAAASPAASEHGGETETGHGATVAPPPPLPGAGAGAGSVSATAPASPFSLETAQQQQYSRRTLRDSLLAAEQRMRAPVGSTGADVAERAGATTVQAPLREPGTDGAAGGLTPAGVVPITRPVRGSSGPQAIPQPSGGLTGLRRGGDGVHADVMMPLGSLPFATSLAVASLRVGSLLPMMDRPASSPNEEPRGLSLALGFGLERAAQVYPPSLPQQLQQQGSWRQGSIPTCSDRDGGKRAVEARRAGSGGGRDGSGGGRLVEEADEEGEAQESLVGSRLGGRDGDDGEEEEGEGGDNDNARSSSSGTSSNELQFQPSWSAPVSGESVAEGGGRRRSQAGGACDDEAVEEGQEAVEEGQEEEEGELDEPPGCGREGGQIAAPGGAGGGSGHGSDVSAGENVQEEVNHDVGTPECGADGGSGGDAAEVEEEVGVSDAEGPRVEGSGGGSGSAHEAVQQEEEQEEEVLPAAEHPTVDDEAPDSDMGADNHDSEAREEEEQEEEEDIGDVDVDEVPDIDEVIDSDGAWEVTSSTAAAAAVQGGPMAGADDGDEEAVEAAEAEEESGEGMSGSVLSSKGGEEEVLAGRPDSSQQQQGEQQLQLLEASSGYETVGSVLSLSGEGA